MRGGGRLFCLSLDLVLLQAPQQQKKQWRGGRLIGSRQAGSFWESRRGARTERGAAAAATRRRRRCARETAAKGGGGQARLSLQPPQIRLTRLDSLSSMPSKPCGAWRVVGGVRKRVRAWTRQGRRIHRLCRSLARSSLALSHLARVRVEQPARDDAHRKGHAERGRDFAGVLHGSARRSLALSRFDRARAARKAAAADDGDGRDGFFARRRRRWWWCCWQCARVLLGGVGRMGAW